MDHLIGEGLLGIVTGIVTTVLLFLMRAFWANTLAPALRALQYKGLKVDGTWEGRAKDQMGQSESRLLLKQRAHALSGNFTFKFSGDDKEFTLDYDVTGAVWEGYVTLNFVPSDRRITSSATALLKIRGGGGVMGGTFSFRNADKDDVEVIRFDLARHERLAGFNAIGNAQPRPAELSATQGPQGPQNANGTNPAQVINSTKD